MNFQWKYGKEKRGVLVIEFAWWNYFSQHCTHTNAEHFEILFAVCGQRPWDCTSIRGAVWTHPHYCESRAHTNTIGSALVTTGCWALVTPRWAPPIVMTLGLHSPDSFLPFASWLGMFFLLHQLFPRPVSLFPLIFKCYRYFLYGTPFLTILV